MRNLFITLGLLIAPFILWLAFLPQAGNAFTGIQFDSVASTTGPNSSQNTLATNITIGVHSDEVLVVYTYNNASKTVTADYNGSAMTEIPSANVANGALNVQGFYLLNPTSGTHTVTISASNMTSPNLTALAYYNVKQTSFPDVVQTNLSTANPPNQLDNTFNTTINNDWGILYSVSNGVGTTYIAPCFVRSLDLVPASTQQPGACDTNGVLGNAGSFTLSANNSNIGTNRFLISSIAFAPDTQPSTFNFWQFFEF